MDHTDQPDLLWNAFCYVADEMSAGEQEIFERQLAADQSAREAVVRAVQLTQAMASLPAASLPVEVSRSPIQTGGNSRPARRSVGVWSVATGLAVCLMLISGFYFGGMFEKFSVSPKFISRNDALDLEGAGVLVSIWSDSESALEEFAGLDLLFESEAESGGLEEEIAESEQLAMVAFDDTLEEQFHVPDWMLAAVTSQLQTLQSSETQPEDN